MGRIIGAVVAGYVVIFVFVFATLMVAYFTMGTERAFQPGSYEVSATWLVVNMALGLVAAILGGLVASMIAKTPGTRALAAVVLVLGVLLAIPGITATRDETEVRGADVPSLEAMSKAQQPTWILFLNPVLGAVGVLIGGRVRKD